MKLLLALAVIAAAGLVLLSREQADAPLTGRDDPAPPKARTQREPERAERPLARTRCPEGVPDCREVTGRIIYVERVDPDGDGDLHVVVAAGGISLPGVTAVDVAPELRPRRDPRAGDTATAAGPVQRGSYGQDQIHALRFRVRRERG
jgi:hypothetical protein